jgi:hypothetical protein
MECPTRSLTLPVLIVRAKALNAGRDACAPSYARLAPLGLSDVCRVDQVTMILALLSTD